MTPSISSRLILLFAILSFGLISLHAQEMAKTPSDPAETNVNERVRVLESELERQNAKLDQLQKAIEEQQLTIKALLEKLSAQAQTQATSTEAKASATAQPVANKATEPITAEPQTQTVEQRLAKVEVGSPGTELEFAL